MFSGQFTLRLYAFACWLISLVHIISFWKTEFFSFVMICFVLLSVTLAVVTEIKKLSINARAGIFLTAIMLYHIFLLHYEKSIMVSPLVFIFILLTAVTFLSRPLLIYLGILWNVITIAYFFLFPATSFTVIDRSDYVYIFILAESALYFSFVFVSTVKRQYEKNKELTEIAFSANRAKNEFLTNITHEIRTPMNAIVGMTELITSPEKSSVAEIKAKATVIKNAGNTLINLVNDILEISKIESGSIDIFEAPYGIRSLIFDIIEIISVKISNKPLIFLHELDIDAFPDLIGDEQRIRQILLNLLSNAIKYTNNGHILLQVCEVATAGEMINLSLSVSDTGIGIKEEHLKEIFGKFSQFDLEKNKHIEGSGLGLAITKNLVDSMGGKITVRSEYGKGSVFTVVLPQKISKTRSEILGEERRHFKVSGVSALVVDDNFVNLSVTSSLLKLYDISSETASSGKEAVEMTLKNKYDIIFMDYMMPEMNGIDTTKKIREHGKNGCDNVPVVALTANTVSGMEKVFLSSGMDAFLPKPVVLSELDKILLKFIPSDKIFECSPAAEVFSGESDNPKITGLDTEKGIEYCGGRVDGYIEVLKVFCASSKKQLENIENAVADCDYGRITLEAHALKSAAKGIGADRLFELSRLMESSGREKNISYINQNIAALLLNYQNIIKSISEYLARMTSENFTEKLPIEKEKLKDSIYHLIIAAESYDLDEAKLIISELGAYHLEQIHRERLEDIKASIMRFSYSETAEKAKLFFETEDEK